MENENTTYSYLLDFVLTLVLKKEANSKWEMTYCFYVMQIKNGNLKTVFSGVINFTRHNIRNSNLVRKVSISV